MGRNDRRGVLAASYAAIPRLPDCILPRKDTTGRAVDTQSCSAYAAGALGRAGGGTRVRFIFGFLVGLALGFGLTSLLTQVEEDSEQPA